MKTQELRQGNFISLNETMVSVRSVHSDNTFRCIKLIKDDEEIGCFSISMAKPIPLQGDWLLKFGFEKSDNYFIKNGFIVYQKRDGIDGRQRFYFAHDEFNPNLDFIHQLQNLYFSLTGEELKLKL